MLFYTIVGLALKKRKRFARKGSWLIRK